MADSIGCTYHQLKYSSPNGSNKKKTRATQKSIYLSDNEGKNRSGEWAKRRKGSDRNSDRTRKKNKRGDIEKWDQTDSLEIPDRGETSEIPRPPFGVLITLLGVLDVDVTVPFTGLSFCFYV